jgi:DNA-binding transcriptional MocR family regulator
MRIARLADTGQLAPGIRLPAERELAAALSVSRNTVAAAYQMLRDEGMADSRQGSGTRIVPHRTTPAAVHRANGFFAGQLMESAVRYDLTLATVDCAPQVAEALTSPRTMLGRTEMEEATGGSGYLPYGLPALRAAIAAHLSQLGQQARTEQILVTTGGQQALDLLIRSEVLPGQPAVVEDPTFPGALDALHRAGASVLGVRGGGSGLDVDHLEHLVRTHRPALVYLILTHHNPTGFVVPATERRRIARLAAEHPDTIFVDDTTLAELPLGDEAVPAPLGAFGGELANCVTVGSFSKMYWGGLRTGWVRADCGLIGRLAAAKAVADLGSPAFGQAVVAALLEQRHDEILKWRTGGLRTRYDAVAAAFRASLPGWTWAAPQGGLTVWARLPGGIDSGVFVQHALRHDVAVVPGRLLSASGTHSSGYVRLAFTQPPAVLTAAIAALGAAAAQYRPPDA